MFAQAHYCRQNIVTIKSRSSPAYFFIYILNQKQMKIDYLRLLRYVIGAYLLIGGIVQLDFVVLLMGAIISLMAIFNVGCFGGQCAPNLPKKNNVKQSSIEEVSFEEVR
ncbi:MAG: hypothetical protein RLZZ211_1251 [Bacteroidota bacterium]